ncbi:MAG TPA: type VI secretion system baseplate subunit TssG [Cellvibrio sp.]|nr:type VI secretion system baseplate subunit TssG [Cellvibrio sp.]
MSSPSWRKNSSVVEQLLDKPHAYSFFQAVRILERATLFKPNNLTLGERSLRAKNAIAGFAPPGSETIRITTSQSFSFPNAEIYSVASSNSSGTPVGQAPTWTMRVNFMGLTGCMGVMPYHYTELILQRLKLKDESLTHFFDLFNHRSISLFYQASTKYHLPLEYERKKLVTHVKKYQDRQTQVLLSLLGLGTRGLENRQQIKDESLIFYSGLLTQQVRTTIGLKQMLQDYFAIPVAIQEFVGQWQELIPDVRTRIASRSLPKGQNAQLGNSAMLGYKGWFAQSKVRIELGPLNREQFYKFAPGTAALRALSDMVRTYVGVEHDYDFIISVKRRDLPRRIALNSKASPIIGWNTWLSSSEKLFESNSELLKISVSAKRLQ